MSYTTICTLDDITPNTGVCALVGNEQVAIFRITHNGKDQLFAIANHDPFSKANVLSRGIVGCKNGEPFVASPIYKQLFHLPSGQCLDDESVQLKTWPVELAGKEIRIPLNQSQVAA